MANVGQFFMGAPTRIEQVQRFQPDQLNILRLLMGMGSQGLQNPYQGFEPIAQQARSQFSQQTIPSIAERFTSMGGGRNALSSPLFASQMGQAGSGLEQALASMQSQYGMQNRSDFMKMLGMGLEPNFDNYLMQAEPGMLQKILPTLGKVGANVGLGMLTGGTSAIAPALSGLLSML